MSKIVLVSGRPIHAVAAIICVILAAGIGCARKTRAQLPPSPAPAVVQPNLGSTETGIASWYGHPYHGRRSASGEIYDMEQLTAAHRTLPFGTWVEVTDLQNQKIVDVRINDRGPFIDGRIIDLSLAAARAIDMVGPGVARVRLRVIAPPVLAANKSAPPPVRIPPAPTPAQPIAPLPSLAPQQPSVPVVESYAVQAGAFSERDDAEKFQATIRSQFEETRVLLLQSAWRVLVGRQLTFEDANRLASKVLAIAGQAVVVKDR